jgi:hypothetical protein
MSNKKLDRAVFWLEKGFKLLPCQPGQKWLVGGFGLYLTQITDKGQAAQWWGCGARSNLAVLAPDNFYILDFDKISVFASWADVCPSAARSYTESTPRGGRHVFLRGAVPPGVQLIDGVEIKRIVLVAPSDLGGVFYKRISQTEEILETDPVQVLSSLSKPGHATPYAMRATETRRAVSNPLSHVDQIKQYFTVSHVLKIYRPEIKFSGRGDFQTCACPFHSDSKPSFYFSDAKGIWGCHACNVRGDVINLYARFEAVNVIEAIHRMWAVMA